MKNYFTEKTAFYGNTTPEALAETYGTPLYVYNENILRQRAKEMATLVDYPNFRANYSIKANSNPEILKIIKSEGLVADAMSCGEIALLLSVGYTPEEIFFVPNNVSDEELSYALEKGVLVSADSLSQLARIGRLKPGCDVAIRFNPGVGAGHHEKVTTGGKKTKFGVNIDAVEEVKAVLAQHQLKLVGINQHIGSLFMEGDAYIEGVRSILAVARHFENLRFVDMGGGFGIPYRKQEGQARLDLADFRVKLTEVLRSFASEYGREILFKTEPGRYNVAEGGVLLGRVHAVKNNYATRFVGTDLGFNVLVRPAMYDSHHDIEVYGKNVDYDKMETVTVVGNICESGDILAKDRQLPVMQEGDLVAAMDAGAYGFAMSSNYNMRLRPAEVLIGTDGNPRLIRRRDTFEDLMRPYQEI